MLINKDTSLYCSFAKYAGNKGCIFHNHGFNVYKINAIYKSFSVEKIKEAMQAMKILDIKGAGITMPFKIEVLEYLDIITDPVKEIGACNTVINNNGILIGYNTDYLAVKDYLNNLNIKELTILGNGGYSKAVQYVCKLLGINTNIITRDNWNNIKNINNTTIFNCTPVDNINCPNCRFIDCIVTTETGRKLAALQARYQFKLYTGIDYD